MEEPNEDFGINALQAILANFNELKETVKVLEERNSKLTNARKFGLIWEDKPDAQVLRVADETPVIVERENAAVTTDGSVNHMLFNGDNFHALAALRATHTNKVDVIYIDPPYNTGNKDFIYNDNYLDKNDSYLHSKWLSFMDKRLRIASELLNETGVIFASIDDSEHARLKLLMDEIFGYENFLTNIVWNSTAGSNTGNMPVTVTESVLVYAKKKSKVLLKREPFINDGKMKLKDDHFIRRGLYALDKLDSRRQSSHYTESLNYQMEMPDGTLLYPGGKTVPTEGFNWLWSKSKVEWGKENGFIVFKNLKNGWTVYNKRYELVNNKDEVTKRGQVFKNLIPSSFATTATGSKEAKAMGVAFDYPKPTKLLKRLVALHSKTDAVVLDFFAGSGTTAHAVAELNKEDGGTRQCILVTDGGKTESSGHSSKHGGDNCVNIAEEVTYERIRRALTGKDWVDGKQHPQLTGDLRYFDVKLVPNEELDLSEYLDEFVKVETGLFTEVESVQTEDISYRIFANENLTKFAVSISKDDGLLEELGALLDYLDPTADVQIFGSNKSLGWPIVDLLAEVESGYLKTRGEVTE